MNGKKLIIFAVLFVVVVVGALLLYNDLSDRYTPDMPEENQTANEQELLPAPDFTVVDGDGRAVRLSDFKGKPVVVNFWATWCGPCKMELPYFDKLHNEYDGSVEFLMVNLTDGARETIETADEFMAESGYTFPVYYDTQYSAANAYRIYSIPLTIFVDGEGNLVNSHTGAMDEATLTSYVKNLLNN